MTKSVKQKGTSKKKKQNTKKGFGLFVFLLLMIAVVVLLSQLYLRKFSWNQYLASDYEIMGADVSYYQGEIDWKILSNQIDFAYMKATEGSYHVDIRFAENKENAIETGLPIGAYHFFSFESSGKAQADNYINTVGKWNGMLRPVIDVEFYTTTEEVKDTQEIQKELQVMLDVLEAYYGCKPVIYVTQRSYFTILERKFDEYPLWIRNVYFRPLLIGKKWAFWQYEDQAQLDGYSGEQDKIDLNVFYGNRNTFEDYKIYED